jgi:hypothetical protein
MLSRFLAASQPQYIGKKHIFGLLERLELWVEKSIPKEKDVDPINKIITYSFGGRAAVVFVLVFLIVSKNILSGGITLLLLLPMISLMVLLGGKVVLAEMGGSRMAAVKLSSITLMGFLVVVLGATLLGII